MESSKICSYISSITTGEIIEVYNQYLNSGEKDKTAETDERTATQRLTDFFGVDDLSEITINAQNTQRVILVSKSFREEVLSAVNWLIGYGVAISCIQIKAYKFGEEILLDAEQILPQNELKDYTMKLFHKNKEEQFQRAENAVMGNIRNAFWNKFLPEFSLKSKLFENRSAENCKNCWFGCASGISGVAFTFLICRDYCGVELSLIKSNKEGNKKIFDALYLNKEKIEDSCGKELSWERLSDAKMSRLILRNKDLSINNEERWADITEFLIDNMIKLEEALKPELIQIKNATFLCLDFGRIM